MQQDLYYLVARTHNDELRRAAERERLAEHREGFVARAVAHLRRRHPGADEVRAATPAEAKAC